VLLGVGLRLLLQVAELAHTILLCLTGPGLPPGGVPCAPTVTPGTDAPSTKTQAAALSQVIVDGSCSGEA